ncbi:MAG: dihydroneopterin aldolase [OM182 bacterium MED-G24]|uniref:7,8-dihydroneopterin aldolase n=1 Tax=OM182 bacterium MED-G24 TaxID=1986255 RepID=A0A2A5WIR0_9GAMM|nr:MAG: dihydroneopterin aldolase [OM182 bacterium MED-G24]|tara:strand:- start:314 stop:679 length:366 start_codon:yes stop_codon:yes gene_type:complete
MDRLAIKGLSVETIIGINPWERETRQPLVIDLELQVDTQAAARSDKVADTVDYGKLARRLRNLIAQSRFQLIERVAETIAGDVLGQDQRILAVTVCVTKPHAIPDTTVSLTITRPRTLSET